MKDPVSSVSKKIIIKKKKAKSKHYTKESFCDEMKYYQENVDCIIMIQSWWRNKIAQHNIIHKKLTKRQQMVNDIFKPNKYGKSQWITRTELSKTPLKLSSNGNCRHGKFFNDTRFHWEKEIDKNTVVRIRTIGYDTFNNENINRRAIRKDIKDYHYRTGCVCCGSNTDLVIDHKNDLYNDPRVLDQCTQTLSDFQCLCNHCNLQKRQICKDTKKNKKRYKSTNIPQLKVFGIDFINGDETFNPNDINALQGTYWYDPIAFMEHIKKIFH